METIVVGVDGSAGADEAITFAAREARLRGATLNLVTGWHVPSVAYEGVGMTVAATRAEFEEDANRRLEGVAERLASEFDGLTIERVVREGRAASVLVREAREAALLVVGSRGHGGFVGLLVGSVSSECAHHAPCPIAIVPSDT